MTGKQRRKIARDQAVEELFTEARKRRTLPCRENDLRRLGRRLETLLEGAELTQAKRRLAHELDC